MVQIRRATLDSPEITGLLRLLGTGSSNGVRFGDNGDTNLFRDSANTLATNDALLFLRALSTDVAVLARATGDGANRFVARVSGSMEWGNGTDAADVNLYRAGISRLATDDAMRIGRFTTAERDALATADADLIYNTDTSKFQGRAGGAWVDLH